MAFLWSKMGCNHAAATAACAATAPSAADGGLVREPRFEATGGEAPRAWVPRPPAWRAAACRVGPAPEGGLVFDAPGRPWSVMRVEQRIEGVEAGQWYGMTGSGRLCGVPNPRQSLMMRVTWLEGERELHPAGMLVRGPFVHDGAFEFRDVLQAPEGADAARLALDVKWLKGGRCVWQFAGMTPGSPPAPRQVRVGTVWLIPRDSTPERNLDLFCAQVDAAGEAGVDIVCLPETLTVPGTGKRAWDCAEPIPGPSTARLGEAARRNRLWVVAGLPEVRGETLYNTAVLLDREGRVAGCYRKVHLPREEWLQGITPGTEYPVFETDFGIIAMAICYDWFFPEATACFAMRGAEMVFAPTWGNTWPDRDGRVEGETTFRVRARDNGVYMVPSVYSGNSLVIDRLGRILASSDGREGLVTADVELGARPVLPWVGEWRAIGPRDRMPETYEAMTSRPPPAF
ncbi:MAG: carbon-nitrogen hydrolase family protein [Kiritimatiellaeota bacterium]|nr:carbon-nitrogen hydrolase family protein [Kiritimatiellota bacterium]